MLLQVPQSLVQMASVWLLAVPITSLWALNSVATVGDFDFFVSCNDRVRSAGLDCNMLWVNAGISCSFCSSIRGAGSGVLWVGEQMGVGAGKRQL